jgi:excisionase family DNA binding protein
VLTAPANGSGEGLLTVDQAAARLGVTVPYLYRRAKSLPFARKVSHKQLRFDPAGLDGWLAEQRPQRTP